MPKQEDASSSFSEATEVRLPAGALTLRQSRPAPMVDGVNIMFNIIILHCITFDIYPPTRPSPLPAHPSSLPTPHLLTCSVLQRASILRHLSFHKEMSF